MNSPARKYFTEAVLPCHARMYAAALAITGSPDDASDAVQTAMLRVWETVSKGMVLESPVSYCLSAVRNICFTEILRNKRLVPIDGITEEASESNRTEKAVELTEVTDALGRLSETERRAVEMSAYSGCSADQIAQALGTNAVNARQILSRGRKRLRSFFNKG